jgi:hypothetical protein
MFARRGKPRRCQFGGKPAQIRKAGGEAHEENQEMGGAVQFDDALRREAGVPGHVFEIGAALTAESHWDFDRASLAGRPCRRGSETRANQLLHSGMQVEAGIEIHQHAGEGGMQVHNAADSFEAAGQVSDVMVGVERDLVAKGDEKRTVAGRADDHFLVMLPPEDKSYQLSAVRVLLKAER